jgi:prefoldin subunit 5
MKELENLNAKLDLIRKNKDEVNANTANLNATLTHIEGAHPK